MNILKTILAWITGPFTPEVSPMSEVETAATAPDADPAAAPAPVNTDTLKAVLIALGHDLEHVWDDAVAIARKAL